MFFSLFSSISSTQNIVQMYTIGKYYELEKLQLNKSHFSKQIKTKQFLLTFKRKKIQQNIRITGYQKNHIKLSTTTLLHLTKSDRTYFINQNYIKISDSLFKNCRTGDITLDSNGGAINANIFSEKNSKIIFERICFDQCSARSSGGAAFLASQTVEIHAISVTKCFAQTSQCFSIFSTHSNNVLSSFTENGERTQYDTKKSKTATIGGQYQSFSNNNVSRNFVYGPVSCVHCYYFTFLNIGDSFFIKNEGQTAFNFAEDNAKQVRIERSFIYGNKFNKNGFVLETNSNVEIIKTWFEIIEWKVSDKKSSHLITFNDCYFNAKNNEIVDFWQSESMTECHFGVLDLPTLNEIEVKCFSDEKERSNIKFANLDFLSPKMIVLICLASITGTCAVYIFMTLPPKEIKVKKVRALNWK